MIDFRAGEVIVLDKPLNWTSFDLVSKVKSKIFHDLKLKKVKVGHAGTLDPLATGVLVICTGKATKRIETFQAGIKEYVATIKLGATTPSFDMETEEDDTFPTAHITEELIQQTLSKFIGAIEQVPPAYSAVKVNGKRAYEMARKGEEVKLKPKTLVIDEIELLETKMPEITIRVLCSKGTYIRALARDIGESLNSGGYLTYLRRTRVGDFTEKDAISIEEFEKNIELLKQNKNYCV